MPQSKKTLCKIASLLCITERLHIVDIGANPIGEAPPYASLLSANLARLTGFEPQKSAFESLLEQKQPNEEYLPYAVGDGDEHTLNVYKGSGFTSLLRIRRKTVNVIRGLHGPSRLMSEDKMGTRTLDTMPELQNVDFLKIDIQGGELTVFQHGKEKLLSVLAIQTEVAFFPLYEDQPMFGDIDVFLRSIGFKFHRFIHISRFPLGKLIHRNRRRKPMSQALDGDVVYVRDFSDPAAMSDVCLAKLALLAHACFVSYDLAALCISILEDRGIVATGTVQSYTDLLPEDYTLG